MNPITYDDARTRPDHHVPLGQLLVDAGLLDAADLEHLLEEQRRTGQPLGRILVDGGYVPGRSIALALAEQHGGPVKTEWGFATTRSTNRPPVALRDVSAPAPMPTSPPAPTFAPEAAAVIEEAAPPPEALAPETVPLETVAPEVFAPALAPEAPLLPLLRIADEPTMTVAPVEVEVAVEVEVEVEAEAATAPAPIRAESEARIAELEAQLRDQARTLADKDEQLAASGHLPGRIEELEAQIAELEPALNEVTSRLSAAMAGVQAAATLRGRVEELEAQVAEQPATIAVASDARAYLADRHMVYLPSAGGYDLVERAGPVPTAGCPVMLASGTFRVARVGPAPFLGDALACAYLEPFE